MADDIAGDRPGPSRGEAVPNAGSPQLLTHLLEMVARGVRSTRALQEALGVDQRTVRTYVRAGGWLGLLDDAPEPLLTAEGLALVYAGAHRRDVWTRVLRTHPFFAALLDRTKGRPPSDHALQQALYSVDAQISAAMLEERVTAMRGLLAPLFAEGGVDGEPPGDQLALPLVQTPRPEPEPSFTEVSGRSFSPDVYRWLLAFLLDHGELTLGHVRGLLDRAGADDVPIGGYVDLALARGDAVRVEERLIVTPEAVTRRDLVGTTAGVILSDGEWRAHLAAVRAAIASGSREIRTSGRFRPWDRRLLGKELDPVTLEDDLDRVLRDRSLTGWPHTTGRGTVPRIVSASFLDVWEQDGLVVTLPPALVQLWEGVAGLNRRLRNARHKADSVGAPSVGYRSLAAHGGPLHPGEPLPRAVPDARTLRQRLVLHAPYVAMLVGLLLAHRADPPALEIRHQDGTWRVVHHRRPVGSLLDVMDGFADARRWTPSRRTQGGISPDVFVSLQERLGLAVIVGRRLVLDDALFLQLRAADEEALLLQRLTALSDALAAFVEGLGARNRK